MVRAQDSHPQRLVMAGPHGAGQVVEPGTAPRAAVALAVPLRIIPAVTGDLGVTAARAADAVGPAVPPDQLVALRVIIDQRPEVYRRPPSRPGVGAGRCGRCGRVGSVGLRGSGGDRRWPAGAAAAGGTEFWRDRRDEGW